MDEMKIKIVIRIVSLKKLFILFNFENTYNLNTVYIYIYIKILLLENTTIFRIIIQFHSIFPFFLSLSLSLKKYYIKQK